MISYIVIVLLLCNTTTNTYTNTLIVIEIVIVRGVIHSNSNHSIIVCTTRASKIVID